MSKPQKSIIKPEKLRVSKPSNRTIYRKEELETGKSYPLQSIPDGVRFRVPGARDILETITYPHAYPITVNTSIKRDCWNTTKKVMDLIPYRTKRGETYVTVVQ